MRIDHHAYQRATRVASAGLAVQLAIALLLLIFGKTTGPMVGDPASVLPGQPPPPSLSDSASVIASAWAFAGLVVWLGLILVFHQHKLERLESLEFDSGPRTDDQGRMFAVDEARVARRRLDLMHRVLMPALSLVYAAMLVGFAWATLWWMGLKDTPGTDAGRFGVTELPGWQLAVAFGSALIAFIFSRFVAGMALQKAWSILRGGAAVMVGNALVCSALGVGTVFVLLEEKPGDATRVLEGIAYGISFFMIGVASETLLSFVLNLYRPRRVGEVPRPAFDSRVLSLFAAPDSIVRSINEAVNYQFGFDITSSWGYQLLLRNFIRLVAIGAFVVLGLTTLVVVQPQEQAVRLRFGERVGDVYQGGPMGKLPWPVDTALVLDVNRVRELPLGVVQPVTSDDVITWGSETAEVDKNSNLYLVGAGARPSPASGSAAGFMIGGGASEAQATDQFALVEADIVLQYRVRNGELSKFLDFSGDSRIRGEQLGMRERTLRSVAMREVTRVMSTRSLDAVLSPPIDQPLVDVLARSIQAAYDALDCGVEVVGVSMPRLRPPGGEGGKFEELSIARQNGRRQIEKELSTVSTSLSMMIGDVQRADELVRGIDELKRLEAEAATDPDARAKADALQARLEQIVIDSRARAASVISNARAARWTTLMEAQAVSQQVLGQASAWKVDPELYRTRKTMEALSRALSGVRVKYMLLPDAERVQLDIEMQEASAGLNLGEYLERKPDEGGG
jgi:regulator of protease activity HflC (stomatin/prohibitin superfamily)